MSELAELACVVLAVGSPPELPGAVQSLLAQDAPVELLVVSSGGGDAESDLRAAGLGVEVRRVPELLLPGGARNVGVAATTAPWIAFLAADCRAEPGWVTARLRAHRQGAAAVASAITNPFPRNLPAWASQVALFARRMPGAPAAAALRYGASYERRLLARLGPFRGDLRGGEDTEMHARFAGELEIAWVPAVRTAHLHPRSVAALLADHLARGGRAAGAQRSLGGPTPRQVAVNALRRMPAVLRLAWRHAAPGERRWIAAAAPLLPAATLAYAAGALAGPAADGTAFAARPPAATSSGALVRPRERR